MPSNALANPLVLPILGLLVEQPRHPYAVFSELRARYDFLKVRNATVYTLLNTLTRAGWIIESPQQDSPVLSTTVAGREALAERVTVGLRGGALSADAEFMTALAYVGILAPKDAVAALQDRRDRLRDELARIRRVLDDSPALELHMIEVHYYHDRLRHDLAWIERTITRMGDGSLAWPRRG
ncbi:PadR family transcriptional regulator [Humibacter ginsenosidimutans]|uniref:PadR family transcriptional regulator n=1 Tax=Humibacter ginsenosidimutans TaxID=2599293 RepID=UPI00143CEE51|nr:helix-turn-helix transcriptional regulator [Humibacter ginsenosidimutans]